MAHKECIICNVELNSENTKPYRIKKYIHKCNNCVNVEKLEFIRKDRQAEQEKHLSRSRKHQAKLKKDNPKKYTASQQRGTAKKRAEEYGRDYKLTTEYIMAITPDVCQVLGIEQK